MMNIFSGCLPCGKHIISTTSWTEKRTFSSFEWSSKIRTHYVLLKPRW